MHVCTVYTTNRVIYIVVYLRLCPLTLYIMGNEIKKKKKTLQSLTLFEIILAYLNAMVSW